MSLQCGSIVRWLTVFPDVTDQICGSSVPLPDVGLQMTVWSLVGVWCGELGQLGLDVLYAVMEQGADLGLLFFFLFHLQSTAQGNGGVREGCFRY